MRWKNRIRQRLILIFLFTFLLALFPFSVKAQDNTQDNTVMLHVSVNFDQTVKYGRRANVNLQLFNDGNGFSGYVQSILKKRESTDNCMYQKAIEVKEDSAQKLNFTVPITEGLEEIEFCITNSAGTTLAETTKKMNISEDGSVFYLGVIGDNLDYLRGLEGKAFKPIDIPVEDIPTCDNGLDMYDGIFIGTSFMDKEAVSKLKSLKEWNRNGGNIILARKSPVICDYMGIGGSQAVSVKDSKGETIYNVYHNGEGVIVEWVYTQNLKTAMKIRREDAISMMYDLQTHYSDVQQTRLFQDAFVKNGDERQLLRSLELIDKKYMPKPLVYVLIIVVYSLLAGPILFYLLRRFQKTLWYYILVSVISGLFVVIFVIAGKNIRIHSPIVHSIKLYNYKEAMSNMEEECYFSVVMPNTKSETLSIQSKSDIEFKESVFDAGYSLQKQNSKNDYQLSIVKKQNTSNIEVQKPLYMKPYVFESTSKKETMGKIRYQLSYDGEKVTGYLINNLGLNLEHAILVSNYQMIPIREFKNGQEFVVHGAGETTNYYQLYKNMGSIIEKMTGLKGIENQSDLLSFRKFAAMEYCLKNKCLTYNNNTYLIGFVKGEKKNYHSNISTEDADVGMVIYQLDSVEKKYKGKTLITDISKYQETLAGSFNPITREIVGDSVVVNYYLPTSVKIDSLILPKSVNEKNKFNGTISIYDNKNQEYQNILSEDSSGEITHLTKRNFITNENKIQIKYSLSEDATDNKVNVIPVLSVTTEVK